MEDEICPYATFHLLGFREEMDPSKALNFQTFPHQNGMGGPAHVGTMGPNGPMPMHMHSRSGSQSMVSVLLLVTLVSRFSYSAYVQPRIFVFIFYIYELIFILIRIPQILSTRHSHISLSLSVVDVQRAILEYDCSISHVHRTGTLGRTARAARAPFTRRRPSMTILPTAMPRKTINT